MEHRSLIDFDHMKTDGCGGWLSPMSGMKKRSTVICASKSISMYAKVVSSMKLSEVISFDGDEGAIETQLHRLLLSRREIRHDEILSCRLFVLSL